VAWKILIVDDHRAIRSALRRLLESRPDYLVCGEAEHGREAIEKLRECSPDAVILDISMPVMNGLETAKVLRSMLPHVRILMFTSFVHPKLSETALAAGADEVLAKSSSPNAVLTALVKLFGRAA